MDFPAEFLAAEARLVQAAGTGPFQVTGDQWRKSEHGEGLEGEQDTGTAHALHPIEDLEILLHRHPVDHEAGTGHARGIQTPESLSVAPPRAGRCLGAQGRGASRVRICQGRPYLLRSSIKGSGSNCSMLNTPLPRHSPVSIILAPIMAGTPVV